MNTIEQAYIEGVKLAVAQKLAKTPLVEAVKKQPRTTMAGLKARHTGNVTTANFGDKEGLRISGRIGGGAKGSRSSVRQ